jgi:hypothetical protein
LLWRKYFGGTPAIVAAVANQFSMSSKRGSSARGVAASLQFDDLLGPQLFVRRAFWLDTVIGTTDMPVGTERLCLIGIREGDKWMTFGNDHEIDPAARADMESNKRYSPGPIRIPYSASMRVTIRIYSEDTGVVFDTCVLPIPNAMQIINRR